MTVAERPGCAQCGKEAIGVQSFGCRTSCACRDHAHSLLLSLEPGEKYSTGGCSFERFGPDEIPGSPGHPAAGDFSDCCKKETER